MNCRDWEERLALYAGGDLPKDEAAEVERHLGECPGCQMFSSRLKESQEVLQQLHREPLSPAHFAAVRARVLTELERGRRPVGQTIVFRGLSAFWRRRWISGLAAVAAALLIALALHLEFRPVPKPAMALGHSPAPVGPVLVTGQHTAGITRNEQVPRESQPHQRRAKPRMHPSEQVLIRMVSDNPDVVIYWIAETRGE